MDGESLLESVESATETELSRLGSEKVLLAAIGARLEADAVAGVLAAAFDGGREHLEAWAAEADGDLAAAVADGAERSATLHGEVVDAWPDADGDAEALLRDLGEPADDAARAGAGLVGLSLVLDRLLLQAVSYHVNEADDAAADVVRDLRETVADGREGDAERVAEATDDHEAAVGGAIGAIEAAYAEYADRLEAMGLDPRPIC